MAEIKDVYSLEFNSGQFSAEIDSAISKVEELNAAMEDGADVSEELAAAQEGLVSVLSQEAKGVEQLNQKRNVLVNTQKNLNKESKAGVAVSNQLVNTNKQLAVETGKAAGQQKSLIGQLVGGARAINGVKRAASLLVGVFKMVASALPFGLILAAAGPVLNFFGSMFKTVDKTAEAMEKLNDKTLGYSERLDIIQGELTRLEDVEKRRGYLTENEKEQRKQLTELYQQTADEIVRIEQQRADKIQNLQDSSARLRVKLLGETVQGVEENYKTELKILSRELDKQFAEIQKAEKEKRMNQQQLADERASLLEEYGRQEQLLEQQKQEGLKRIYEKAAAEREKREKEEREKIGQAIIDEFNMRKEFFEELERREKELAEEREKNRQAELDAIRATQKAYDDELAQLAANLKTASDYRQNNREAELAIDLLSLEQERNQQLIFANQSIKDETDRNKAIENINKDYDTRRTQLENIANQEILRLRIEFLKKLRDETAAADPLLTSELNKQIADLELQLETLGRAVNDNLKPEETNKKFKELFEQTTQLIQQASDAVFSTLTAQVQSYISSLDRAADKSRDTLNEIRQNSENFNARQFELEKERLEKLEAERARAVEREKTLAQVQIAINAAVTIAKAAAEGGGIGSAFTIAAALASLIAGFAAARSAAGNAFFHGVEYLERGNNPKGRDTIPARLHEGERVITAADNDKYWDALSAVHNHRIPADILNGFVNGYQNGGLKGAFDMFADRVNLSSELGGRGVFVNVGQDNSGLESRLERIENVLTELPKYMPRTTVSANANGIFKIVEQRMNRAKFSRDRAK